jgi:fatty-acyl-CoA synthase
MISELRPTVGRSVCRPSGTIVLRAASEHPDPDLSSLRTASSPAAPQSRGHDRSLPRSFGIDVIQGWGMTETSPLVAVSMPPSRYVTDDREIDYRVKAGRVMAGVESTSSLMTTGAVCRATAKTVGEFELRGPWITGSYYGADAPELFHDGWLRTGDIGSIDRTAS